MNLLWVVKIRFRKKWHCCIYNITTIWIQIFHTSNSILGTLRFRKGVHNLTRIFLKWSSIYLLLLITIFLDQTLRVALLIVPTLDAQDIVGKKAFKKCKKETLDIIFHLRFVQAIVWYYFFHFNWWCMSQWARFGTSKIFFVPKV